MGPTGPSGTNTLFASTDVNNGANTTNYVCVEINLQTPCGDEDGCRIRMVLAHKTDSSDQVRIIDQHIFMENATMYEPMVPMVGMDIPVKEAAVIIRGSAATARLIVSRLPGIGPGF